MASMETNDFPVETISALSNIWADWLVGFHLAVAQITKTIIDAGEENIDE